MNFHEFNQMNMFTAVNAVFQLFKDTLAKIKALDNSRGRFNDKLAVIAERDARYTTAAAGATASKKSASGALIDAVLRVAKALFVLGYNTGNEQLKAECRLYPSRLFLLRDLAFIRVCCHIAGLARQYISALAEYGIGEPDLETLAGAIMSFRKAREEQQRRLAEVPSVRGMLYEDMADAAKILRNEIDPLMELIKAGHIEFYNQYRAARRIKNLHARAPKKEHGEAHLESAPPKTGPVLELAKAA